MAELLPDELIEALEGIAVRTSQGSFIRMEDARRLIEKASEPTELEDGEEIPEQMSVHQARARAKEFLGKQEDFGPKGPQEPGRAVPASEPQPSSRT
jgi:hypothetical protein